MDLYDFCKNLGQFNDHQASQEVESGVLDLLITFTESHKSAAEFCLRTYKGESKKNCRKDIKDYEKLIKIFNQAKSIINK